MLNKIGIFLLSLAFLNIFSNLNAAETIIPNSPSSFTAQDHPWDHGEKIDLNWIHSLNYQTYVKHYSIFQSTNSDSFEFIGNVDPGVSSYTVEKLDREKAYIFKVIAVGTEGIESAPVVTISAISPTREWFDGRRFPLFFITLIFCGSVVYWILRARGGDPLQIRKIAGLEAVDELSLIHI